jgi:hypothetical protein
MPTCSCTSHATLVAANTATSFSVTRRSIGPQINSGQLLIGRINAITAPI